LFCHKNSIINHGVLGYAMEFVIKKISMNRGAMTWFRMFGATLWNLLIIEPFFSLIFFEKPRWKTILELGGVLGIIGKPSPSSI
jgi:hypothetical protein